MSDPFSVLGVNRDASEQQVKDAFRKAALQWHPDRHVGGTAAVRALAAQKFAEVRACAPRASPCDAPQSASARALTRAGAWVQISRAYEHLSDSSRRRNGGEGRQRTSTQGAWQSHGWRERSYAGAQSSSGSGPYTWRHTDMGGARTAAEDGARCDLVSLQQSLTLRRSVSQCRGRSSALVRAWAAWLLGACRGVSLGARALCSRRALQGTHSRFPHGQLAAGVAPGRQGEAEACHIGRLWRQQPRSQSCSACCAPPYAGAAVALGCARAGAAVSTTKAATAQRCAAAVVCHACTQRRRRCRGG